MPRWPAGLHWQAGGTPNVGGRGRRIPVAPIQQYVRTVRAQLYTGGTVILNSSGAGFVAVGCSGLGSQWYVSQIQINTTTGPVDQSAATLYLNAIGPRFIVGQSSQGGGDTIAITIPMQQGDQLTCVWEGGNPGDTATLVVTGDQEAMR